MKDTAQYEITKNVLHQGDEGQTQYEIMKNVLHHGDEGQNPV